MSHRHSQTIAALCRYIDSADHKPSLAELAGMAGLSPSHLQRTFKAVTGLSPDDYARGRRAERVRTALGKGTPITRAVFDAGYDSSGPFYREAKQLLGMTPKRYRAGGERESIVFALGECQLGHLLVAASEKGLCAIAMGDDPQALLDDLARRFNRARLVPAGEAFAQTLARVAGLVEDPAGTTDLPLDIRGTAFQQKVWQALQRIPPGRTASYREIADAIGRPQASRAVAAACAANPLAVAIPCHRVVRRDGGLSGYRWGVERKRALLECEATANHSDHRT